MRIKEKKIINLIKFNVNLFLILVLYALRIMVIQYTECRNLYVLLKNFVLVLIWSTTKIDWWIDPELLHNIAPNWNKLNCVIAILNRSRENAYRWLFKDPPRTFKVNSFHNKVLTLKKNLIRHLRWNRNFKSLSRFIVAKKKRVGSYF